MEPEPEEVDALRALLRAGPALIVTGAGVSTDSGIPDYRGPETRRRARNPVQHREFVRSAAARKRYWARSMLGWPRFSCARPNAGHVVLAELQRRGLALGPVTQNVDGLHQAAGSRDVVELHGALRSARCLECGGEIERGQLQQLLRARNPEFERHAAELAPDGDADLSDALVERFCVVDCERCGGPLRPDVVFFGENVPRERVERAFALLDSAASLWVIGSSLAVYSGLRFVHGAQKRGVPIAILTLGPTRGDSCAHLRLDRDASATLLALARLLDVPP
ncbi:MAG TPA: NAD-dependent protein deacetylase [Polyangiales bacterium]